jgi:hypothetical protein
VLWFHFICFMVYGSTDTRALKVQRTVLYII